MAIPALHPNPNNAILSNESILHELSLNASRALRRSGFNLVATLLQNQPSLQCKDPAISNASLPPWLIQELLQYHTSPSKLSMEDLLKKHQGSCLPTLLHQKKIAITKTNVSERSIEINHVLISHPDIFLGGPISVHGVLGPFSSLDPQDTRQGWEFFQSPICDSNSSVVSDVGKSKNMIEWARIIRLLSSNGFVSFAIGLHSVLDGILQDYMDLSSVTIFAPPNFVFVASPSPLLDKIVRFHILPHRVTYIELASKPEKAFLRTLVPGRDLEVTGTVNFTRGLSINGVEVVAPDIFTSKKFIIHGISRALEMAEANTS
ncbi:hypothetical protein L1049_024293 [Liquidambar formosana]|uniref:FAS1 domain-containing protein n=1 Tax=Liquidambar formosana TaxID=63359 RepID=A0AAP0RU81_LIQFO